MSWTSDLKELSGEPGDQIPVRYELRPRKEGPVVYCTTCTRDVSSESVLLGDLVQDALEHEGINHP